MIFPRNIAYTNLRSSYVILHILQVSSHALESSLLKYSAKEYYFRASLCHLCVDVLNADHAIKKYGDLFPAFADSRECKFVKVSLNE